VTTQTENGLVGLAINWVKANRLPNGAGNIQITEDTNLFETGLLDSFGFVELLLFLESQCGRTIDLTDVDVADFSQLKGLCRIVLGSPPQG
jgi:acyl carrier protein